MISRDDYTIRLAAIEDLSAIVDFRILMFQSFMDTAFSEEEVKSHELEYFSRELSEGRFFAWVAEYQGGIIACSALSFYQLPPKPWNLEGRYGYVSSMYTHPDHRNRGLGRRMLQSALDCARENGVVNVTMHASESGKPLYRSMNFVETNEMRFSVPQNRV